MSDLAPILLSSAAFIAPLVGTADPVHDPEPPPARAEDPFGPSVVVSTAAQRPALVIYDAQGRLTTPVPPDSGTLPPTRIDADAPPSLVYTG